MHESYMHLAISEAKKGASGVKLNPMVGAILVKNQEIVSCGHHAVFGGPHAEVNAIQAAGEAASDATLYVTLEPCAHVGKTPPCVDAIIKSDIKSVIVGHLDPNPLVCGKGVQLLKDAGIHVEVGVLETQCRELNEVFLKFITTKTPFVLMKSAMTLDGKSATTTHDSMYITNTTSRQEVHQLRSQFAAIMVGVDTIIHDNPTLTTRLVKGDSPIRVVVDSHLRIPMDANVVIDCQAVQTIVACTKQASRLKKRQLQQQGVTVLDIESYENRVCLKSLMTVLGELHINSILLEGGGTLNYSALSQNIVDKVRIYIAPKIVGGKHALTPVEGIGISDLKDAFTLSQLNVKSLDGDLMIEGRIGGESDVHRNH